MQSLFLVVLASTAALALRPGPKWEEELQDLAHVEQQQDLAGAEDAPALGSTLLYNTARHWLALAAGAELLEAKQVATGTARVSRAVLWASKVERQGSSSVVVGGAAVVALATLAVLWVSRRKVAQPEEALLGACQGDPYAPNPDGTALPDGSRWGAWDPAAVKFLGGSDLFEALSVEVVASGFRWTEGPTWVPEMSALLFSDTVDARIYRWCEGEGVEILCADSGGYDGHNVPNFDELFEPGSNGMALHGDNLYISQHPTHRVVRARLADLTPGEPFHEGAFEVLADASPEGRSLNSPNDVVVASNGDVFFTDPIYGFLKKQPQEMGFAYLNAEKGEHPDQPYLDELCETEGAGCKGVYRIRDGKIELVTKELERPNGLALSKDESCLWVANSDKETPSWTAFALSDDLPLERSCVLDPETLGDESIKASSAGPGLSDGFKLDEQGRIWSSAPGGLVVIDPEEKKVLAKVVFGTNLSNVQFGEGGDVFVTGLGHVWRLRRKV